MQVKSSTNMLPERDAARTDGLKEKGKTDCSLFTVDEPEASIILDRRVGPIARERRESQHEVHDRLLPRDLLGHCHVRELQPILNSAVRGS